MSVIKNQMYVMRDVKNQLYAIKNLMYVTHGIKNQLSVRQARH